MAEEHPPQPSPTTQESPQDFRRRLDFWKNKESTKDVLTVEDAPPSAQPAMAATMVPRRSPNAHAAPAQFTRSPTTRSPAVAQVSNQSARNFSATLRVGDSKQVPASFKSPVATVQESGSDMDNLLKSFSDREKLQGIKVVNSNNASEELGKSVGASKSHRRSRSSGWDQPASSESAEKVKAEVKEQQTYKTGEVVAFDEEEHEVKIEPISTFARPSMDAAGMSGHVGDLLKKFDNTPAATSSTHAAPLSPIQSGMTLRQKAMLFEAKKDPEPVPGNVVKPAKVGKLESKFIAADSGSTAASGSSNLKPVSKPDVAKNTNNLSVTDNTAGGEIGTGRPKRRSVFDKLKGVAIPETAETPANAPSMDSLKALSPLNNNSASKGGSKSDSETEMNGTGTLKGHRTRKGTKGGNGSTSSLGAFMNSSMDIKPDKVELVQTPDGYMEYSLVHSFLQVSDDSKSLSSTREGESLSAASAPAKPVITEEMRSKNQKKKVQIQQELIETERNYVNQLEVVVNDFMKPLKSNAELGLSPAQVTVIFGTIETIYKIHVMMLKELESATSLEIAKILGKKADFLKMYTAYLNNYENSIHELDKCRQNKKFQKFLREMSASPKTKGQELAGFLILPVQRIPRYELLLREIKRCTFEDDADFGDLNVAFTKIQEIAAHINETKRIAENACKLMVLQAKLGTSVAVFNRARVLIKEGTVKSVTLKSFSRHSTNARNMFLLTDVILITNEQYKMKRLFSLRKTRVVDVSDEDPIAKDHVEHGEALLRIMEGQPLTTIGLAGNSMSLSTTDLQAMTPSTPETPQISTTQSSHHNHNEVILVFKDKADRADWVKEILGARWEVHTKAPLDDIDVGDQKDAADGMADDGDNEDAPTAAASSVTTPGSVSDSLNSTPLSSPPSNPANAKYSSATVSQTHYKKKPTLAKASSQLFHFGHS